MNKKTNKYIIYFVLGLFFVGACTGGKKTEVITCQEILNRPPFAACHASTLVELEKGKLMAAFFGGAYEGFKDVCIYTATFEKGKWGPPELVATGKVDTFPQLPCWNPVLFKSDKGVVYLFYKVGKNPREWWGMVKTSKNNGKDWSKAKKLPDGFLGPVRNKPIQLSDGTMLCPSSTESLDEKHWDVHMEIVNRELTNWERISIDTGSRFGVIQPTILQHKNGHLQILCRSRQNCIVQSWSYDNGRTWDTLSCIDVPNPNAGIDATRLDHGQFLLVYNPLLKGDDWVVGRNVLKVALSDDGTNWHDIYTLEEHPEGEYSYPAVIQTSDQKVHITYTDNRKNIKHVVLELGEHNNRTP